MLDVDKYDKHDRGPESTINAELDYLGGVCEDLLHLVSLLRRLGRKLISLFQRGKEVPDNLMVTIVNKLHLNLQWTSQSPNGLVLAIKFRASTGHKICTRPGWQW